MRLRERLSDLDRRVLLLVLAPLSLFLLLSLSTTTTTTSPSPFSFLPPLNSLFYPTRTESTPNYNDSALLSPSYAELKRARIAVCLVGGARRFELTGPSIVENVLRPFPNSDLFLHCPLDSNSYKFSLLKTMERIAAVRVFKPKKMNETGEQLRVLTASNSPNGIQGLLQYFNLVEGCLTMIKSHQYKKNFTYDWIVRTRVDGYWSGPLEPKNFIPGKYIVPPGSSYGGLNDRLGVGDLNTSEVALSRLSLIPKLDSAGFRQLNSETSFRAQLRTSQIPYTTKRIPFCVVTDRKYEFPPGHFGVPVAALSSRGPLSGAKCRPCTVACRGSCVERVMNGLNRWWSWTDWANGTLELCDAHGEWERSWESMFDRAAGKKLAAARKSVELLRQEQCVADFKVMRKRVESWDAPEPAEICKVGLGMK